MVCKSFVSVYDIYIPFIFTFMACSPPYFSVNRMMIFVLACKNGFKSKSVYYGLYSQYIRKITFCLWYIGVGLHTFIFLFMT